MISLFVSLVTRYPAIATVTTKLFCTLTNKYDDEDDDDDDVNCSRQVHIHCTAT